MGNMDETYRRPRRVPFVRAIVLVVCQVSVVVVLHQLGRYRWMRVDWGDLDRWLEQSPPEDVLLASSRVVALVLAWWLLLSSLLYLALALARAPQALRSLRWALVPGLSRLLDGVLAVSLTSSAAWSATQPEANVTVLVGDDSRAAPEPDVTPEADPEVGFKLAIYQAPRPLGEPGPDAWTYTVEAGDSLFEIAETQLAEPARWADIWELNRTRIEAAGFPDADALYIGWVLELPGDEPATSMPSPSAPPATSADTPVTLVTVEPGDSMWSIAECQLEARWQREVSDAELGPYWAEVVDANRDRLLPPGDPDLIYPGQQIVVPPAPADPVGSTQPTPQPSPPPPPPRPTPPGDDVPTSGDETSEPGDTSDEPAPSPTDTQPEVDEVPPEDTAPPTSQPPATEAPPATQPSPTGERPTSTEGTSGEDGSGPTDTRPSPGSDDDDNTWAAVGLLGGGISVAGMLMGLERLRSVQQRRRRRNERIAQPEPRQAEAEAHLRAGANVHGARLLEGALRAAAAGMGSAGFPQLRWVEVTHAGVVLVVAQPSPPLPGFVAEDADRWRTALSPEELASTAGGAALPVPLLTEIGRADDGTEVFVDLEAHGVVTVTGDRTQWLQWLRAVALSVATAPWGAQPRVLVVDLKDDLGQLPVADTVPTLGAALDAAIVHAARLEALLTSVSMPSAAQARAAGVTPDAWEPLLVLSAQPPGDADLAKLQNLAGRRGHGFAVICPRGANGRPRGSSNCHIDTAGYLQFDGVRMTVDAIRFPRRDVEAGVGLLEHAAHAEAVPAGDRSRFQSRLPVDPASTTKGLDDLLGEVRVLVRVLGDVQVVWREVDGSERPIRVERQKGFEALCYLAMREASVDREDLEAALFPGGGNAQKTFQNAVTAARKAVSEQIFPAPMGGRYALSERLVTDYALFAELVRWADETEAAEEGAQLLAEALTLVHGEPFTGAGRGYGWIGPHRGTIVAQVIDAADELAEIRLEGGDWRGAEWAARQGLRAFPCDERMYRILMRCAHRAGNLPGVQRAYEELCDAVADPDDGVEPYDTVHPETLALLDELTRGSRRASA
jgi:DNA-binding SARP family transcriptional activator